MTVFHSYEATSFRYANLSHNLIAYKTNYESYFEKHSNIAYKKSADVFFRYLFCFFLDLDTQSFIAFMNECGEEFYLFFNRISCFHPSYSGELHHVEDVTLFFTRLFYHNPDRFRDVQLLIKSFACFPLESDGFWFDENHLNSIPPTERYTFDQPLSKVDSFYFFFLKMFEYFVLRMEKVSFSSWWDVFNLFLKSFPDCHFLCLMEMTEEYLDKLDRRPVDVG